MTKVPKLEAPPGFPVAKGTSHLGWKHSLKPPFRYAPLESSLPTDSSFPIAPNFSPHPSSFSSFTPFRVFNPQTQTSNLLPNTPLLSPPLVHKFHSFCPSQPRTSPATNKDIVGSFLRNMFLVSVHI